MKCQILISGEHKKNITKLLSAELAQSGKEYLSLQKWPKPLWGIALKERFRGTN